MRESVNFCPQSVNTWKDKYGRSALTVAVVENNNEAVKSIAPICDVNQRSANGQYALRLATERGYTDIVKTLVENGAMMSFPDDDGELPIITALQREYTDIYNYLLTKTRDVNIKSNDGTPLLHICVVKNPLGVADLLEYNLDVLSAVDSFGNTVLHTAIKTYNPELTQLFIKYPSLINIPNNVGTTPLLLLVKHCWGAIREPVLDNLLACGADVHAADSEGCGCLHLAATIKTVKTLVEWGANVNAVDNRSCTPLMNQCKFNNPPERADYLLQHGANPNIPDHDGETPLSMAFLNDSLDIAKLLLAYRGVLTEPAKFRRGPLHRASCNLRMIELFRDHFNDFDVNSKDQINGDTPLICATRGGNSDCVKTLLDMGADPMLPNDKGRTPLIESIAFSCNFEVKDLLIPISDLNHADNHGMVALDFASMNGYYNQHEIMESLLRAGADMSKCSTDLLLESTMNDRFEVTRLLIEWGLDPDSSNVIAAVYLNWYAATTTVLRDYERVYVRSPRDTAALQFMYNNCTSPSINIFHKIPTDIDDNIFALLFPCEN